MPQARRLDHFRLRTSSAFAGLVKRRSHQLTVETLYLDAGDTVAPDTVAEDGVVDEYRAAIAGIESGDFGSRSGPQ